jgi:hypothetical protein
MKTLRTYKCDYNGCKKTSPEAYSYSIQISKDEDPDKRVIFNFSADPTVYEKHACTKEHLYELFAKSVG